MNSEDIAAIYLEAVEIFVNHILYVRELYPLQIFKKHLVYNTPVFILSFPTLKCYIANVLKTVEKMLENPNHEAFKLELIVYEHESKHLESYVIEMLPISLDLIQTSDQYLLEYEQQLRSALYKLAERCKKLPKLPHDSKFKLQIHTTQIAFQRLSHDVHYQEFPWLQTEVEHKEDASQKFSILPLARINKVGLKMQAQFYKF
ncbi:DNA polymerase zeta subunit 2-like [Drosophila sulfurigaster albostrigata]|uniref:DNA polymerase zeta subunit 2-like n=1 Tax=Drosophila sulfurigaster albostrigata TaxID=89887 RepID=UPI002D21E1FE|nr:DNA polymerase zeta subunit 2-like [Drosophila sulfurigaster albostrigata]